MATWYMYSFPDSNSPYCDNLISFYNLTNMILFMIIMLILFLMLNIILNKFINRFLLNNHNIELIWTIIPMLILLLIAFPSIKILYLIDELFNPVYFTIKCIGHQWYWSYEYPEFNLDFDSYMIKDIQLNSFRLLDVDNRMIVPFNIPIRLLTTSVDVIHSWTIPSIGLKMDATPGRINQMNLFVIRPGIYYGQCSEICGMNHSFMPISMEVTSLKKFLNWTKN